MTRLRVLERLLARLQAAQPPPPLDREFARLPLRHAECPPTHRRRRPGPRCRLLPLPHRYPHGGRTVPGAILGSPCTPRAQERGADAVSRLKGSMDLGLFASVDEASPDALVLLMTDGTVVHWSMAQRQFSAFPEGRVRTLSDLIAPGVGAVLCALRRRLSRGSRPPRSWALQGRLGANVDAPPADSAGQGARYPSCRPRRMYYLRSCATPIDGLAF